MSRGAEPRSAAPRARRRVRAPEDGHARASPPAFVAALFTVAVAHAAEQPDLGWIDRAALQGGAVQVMADREERPLTVAVKVAIEVAAPPRAIWDVLTACQIAPEYVPNVVSCRSLEKLDDGRAELFVQVVKPAFFLPTFEHVFRLDYDPYRRIDGHRVSGPIAHMEGSWW